MSGHQLISRCLFQSLSLLFEPGKRSCNGGAGEYDDFAQSWYSGG